jgi:hypothetical protein
VKRYLAVVCPRRRGVRLPGDEGSALLREPVLGDIVEAPSEKRCVGEATVEIAPNPSTWS